MSVVIDASAVLAIVFDETGADVAVASCRGALLSAVNLDEVLHKSARRGIPGSEVDEALARLEVSSRAFDAAQARVSADLHPQVEGTNTSFADRACLALALTERRAIVTADSKWTSLGLPLDIRLIR